MRGILVFAVLLGVAGVAQAQDAATSYEFRIYAAGASAPQVTTPFPAASVVCNRTETMPSGPQTNPSRVAWPDPANAGKFCVFDTATAGGPLVALPSGTYEGAVVSVNSAGVGGESNRDPFLRQRPPVALTAVRLIR